MNVTIEFYVPDNSKRVSHNTHTRFSFRDIIWPDLDFCFYLVWGFFSYGTIFISWGAFWQKLGSQLQYVRPISTGNTKRADFEIWPGLTWFSHFSLWSAGWEVSTAASPASPRPLVCGLCGGGGGVEYTHPNARLAEYHSGAGLMVWYWLMFDTFAIWLFN